VAVVQYTFTQKQYTEQHNETDLTDENIHNIKIHKHNSRIYMHNNKLHILQN
jgi:hypothetical protein